MAEASQRQTSRPFHPEWAVRNGESLCDTMVSRTYFLEVRNIQLFFGEDKLASPVISTETDVTVEPPSTEDGGKTTNAVSTTSVAVCWSWSSTSTAPALRASTGVCDAGRKRIGVSMMTMPLAKEYFVTSVGVTPKGSVSS